MTAQHRYLALLRGINVGGKNIIAKDDLRQSFEELGFTNVRTYIQSGNVLFRSDISSVKKLTKAIEDGLSTRFSYTATAVVFSYRKYQAMIEATPSGWATDDQQKHNALFVLGAVTPKKIVAQLRIPKVEIETVTTGPGVIYWSVSKENLTKTTFMRLAQEPAYQLVTIRNHNTVLKLQKLFEDI